MQSNIRQPNKQPQTPELNYDWFRTVMSATLNQNNISFDWLGSIYYTKQIAYACLSDWVNRY